MCTFRLGYLIAACIASCAISLPAGAQQAANNAPPPPRLEKLEEGEEPAITIRQPEQQSRISEKRAPGGKITQIQVSSGGSTYYLQPNDQVGSALPGDTESMSRTAQWEVAVFDLSSPQEENTAEAAAVPPPPQLPTAPVKK